MSAGPIRRPPLRRPQPATTVCAFGPGRKGKRVVNDPDRLTRLAAPARRPPLLRLGGRCSLGHSGSKADQLGPFAALKTAYC